MFHAVVRLFMTFYISRFMTFLIILWPSIYHWKGFLTFFCLLSLFFDRFELHQRILESRKGVLSSILILLKRLKNQLIDFKRFLFISDFNLISDFQIFMPSTGRAIIPVNPTLSDRLTSMEVQILIDGRETKMRVHPQVRQTILIGGKWERLNWGPKILSWKRNKNEGSSSGETNNTNIGV